ncbi:MAG: hypothetical protein IIT58_02490 [Treponema sp.]|nr:hypothetical protein [Treponema sp.]
MNKPCRKTVCIAIVVLVFLPVFFSCKNQAERRSFTSNLDQIDALINQSQYREAEKLLDTVEKDAFSSWAKIGIFKRYNKINQKEKAEKVLLKGIKKNPENLELLAVYTNFLTRNNRNKEAVSFSKKLQGTKYGSIYSEVVMRDTIEKSAASELAAIFKSAEYFPVYYDAYTGTKNNAWLRNCALLRLSGGAYETAASINPSEVFGSDDAFFWALVMYDACRYGDCVSYSSAACDMYSTSTDLMKSRASLSEIYSLEADAYTSLNDDDNAELVRKDFLKSITDSTGKWIIPKDETSDSLYPVLFVNSAKYAVCNQEDQKGADLLSFSVNQWPDYVPALVGYASFAWESNKKRPEDFEQLALRDYGLATLEMEKYDSRAIIPISDALYRINSSLERNHDPLLYIVRLDLNYKTDKSMNDTQRTADLWRVLEKNAVSPHVYPVLLLDYAENYLLSNKMLEQAWELYANHISSKYNILMDEFFWQNLIKNIHGFAPEEIEYAAYYSALNKKSEDALMLYEYCTYEYGGQEQKKIISPYASDSSVINLAMIYNSLGRRKDALDLYAKVSGRCENLEIKSLVLYRIGLIYYSLNDFKNARRSLEYSVTLDVHNLDAKLLLTKLSTLK